MPYITVLQQLEIHYCNCVTFVTLYFRHFRATVHQRRWCPLKKKRKMIPLGLEHKAFSKCLNMSKF